ncbi:MAG: activator of HSP90 ATPase 1 family protein [Hyphomonadaceae bacterium]|nr:MAG: activator of HSP90 ATPase 1 family protein [Hyphomonadaceae bacterium]
MGKVWPLTGFILGSIFAFSALANAEVLDANAGGFALKRTYEINAPRASVYRALIHPERWWSSSHTWSGTASNLSMSARAGGCFCERLANGGSVQHMTIVYAAPNQELRMFGALGPLQMTGASGHLNVKLEENGGKTNMSVTFDVGGYANGGLNNWALPVDGVLGEQFSALKALVERN